MFSAKLRVAEASRSELSRKVMIRFFIVTPFNLGCLVSELQHFRPSTLPPGRRLPLLQTGRRRRCRVTTIRLTPNHRTYSGTVMEVRDGEAAPVKVIAPAPEAPARTLPVTAEPLLSVAVRPARLF